jgi:hypothetical protein
VGGDLRVARLEARGVRRLLQRTDYEVKSLVAPHPRIALPVARLRGHGCAISDATVLLIEGFPRSANSFAVVAFKMANGPDAPVAHHTHASAHVMGAVRAGIPALVMVREPAESILEMLIARPSCSVRQAIRGWVRFYQSLLPFQRGFVVGEFSAVTEDFGAVIRRVNRRFGTAFREFRHTDANVAACFDDLDRYWRARVGSGPALERLVGRPSPVRDRMKEGLRPLLEDERLAAPRARAQDLFRLYREMADAELASSDRNLGESG